MDAKHTPGEWEATPPDRYNDEWIIHTEAGVGGEIARVSNFARPDNSQGEITANARLIAAAPDMLAALVHIVGLMDASGRSVARRAIAKARGFHVNKTDEDEVDE